MTRSNAVLTATAALLGAAFFVFSQPPSRKPAGHAEYAPWETRVIAPREIRPAFYTQVTQRELDAAAAEGWELVAVTPFVYLNEARGTARDTVTQAYPAYYFKRLRQDR